MDLPCPCCAPPVGMICPAHWELRTCGAGTLGSDTDSGLWAFSLQELEPIGELELQQIYTRPHWGEWRDLCFSQEKPKAQRLVKPDLVTQPGEVETSLGPGFLTISCSKALDGECHGLVST